MKLPEGKSENGAGIAPNCNVPRNHCDSSLDFGLWFLVSGQIIPAVRNSEELPRQYDRNGTKVGAARTKRT